MVRSVTYLDTLALGEGDPGLVLANNEDVALTGSEKRYWNRERLW